MALTQIVKDGLGASLTATSEGGAVTTSVQQGLAKAWNFFDGSAGSIAYADSFNSSTLTDNGTGNYKYAFTNNMSNANFSFGGAAIVDETTFGLLAGTETDGSHARSTSSSGGFWTTNAASINSSADANSISTQIFGDLA
jgi:hypothetical protein